MTILNYGGIWIHINEPVEDKENSFFVTSEEWKKIKDLDVPSIKFILILKNKTLGKIE